MAMHKPKKIKRLQDGGYLTTEDGKPVLDGSNQPIMTGSFPDEDEITARGRAKNAEMLRSLFNRATGRKKETPTPAAPAAPAAAPKASSASDGDVDERDRRMEDAASAPSRMPTRPGQGDAKAKPSAYKKDYEPQKERFLKENYIPRSGDAAKKTVAPSRARATPAGSEPKQTFASTYSNEGRGRPAPAPIARRNGAGTALPKSEGVLKQQEADEKRREGRREQGRIRDAEKEAKRIEDKKNRPAKDAAERKMLSEQPGAVAYRKKREEQDKLSPGQRSAARGKAVKEFFGMAKGGSVSSASKRADGIAQRGKTRGKVY